MNLNLQNNQYQTATLVTECGREFENTFKAIKLIRDEHHNFHIIYRTYANEYIYTFCNPLQDTYPNAHTFKLISEAEAKKIFLSRLSAENVRELFDSAEKESNSSY
ncbi:hypothetical protein [Pontibacter sp. SGAir0037]|uniref:hypothetical protein n=1 Tax=Pontibacter sp. SGAir0037 TaxID=2571030 RepID=UPI0010CD2706|nr:hypothetical protein [Pontibacter sp. SGAir0037]QCR23533.1 hypothetical protein C1N53_15070 [Pontibacter sp. SGAir0037]